MAAGGVKMKLPYSHAVSGERAVQDMQKTLRAFGCNRFGHMLDYAAGELIVEFEFRGRSVSLRASSAGYAAAWLKAHPRKRGNSEAHVRQAKEIASIAVYSILRDWIKGQVTAVETGVLSFEAAFIGHVLLKDGRTVLERIQSEGLLPAPDSKIVSLGKSS